MMSFFTNKYHIYLIISALLLVVPTENFAQDSVVNWLSFDEAKTLFEKTQKPVFVFGYSENMPASKKMLETTLKNPEVVGYVNALFYPVKFDLSTDEEITFFDGKKYTKKAGSKFHSLAGTLLGDSIALPAMIMFDKFAQGQVFMGYKNRDSIFSVLVYYGEEIRRTAYEDWEKIYFATYRPGQKQVISRLLIRWQKMSEVLLEFEKNPKPIFIDLYNNYSIASTIMRIKVYNNPEISKYMNSHFYNVTVDLKSTEEFELKGVKYKNMGAPYNYHSFVYAVLQGKLRFPSFVILNENLELIERVQFFMTPEDFTPLIHFYGDKEYKNKDLKKYLENYKKNNQQ